VWELRVDEVHNLKFQGRLAKFDRNQVVVLRKFW